jgi:hypothetical protein
MPPCKISERRRSISRYLGIEIRSRCSASRPSRKICARRRLAQSVPHRDRSHSHCRPALKSRNGLGLIARGCPPSPPEFCVKDGETPVPIPSTYPRAGPWGAGRLCRHHSNCEPTAWNKHIRCVCKSACRGRTDRGSHIAGERRNKIPQSDAILLPHDLANFVANFLDVFQFKTAAGSFLRAPSMSSREGLSLSPIVGTKRARPSILRWSRFDTGSSMGS